MIGKYRWINWLWCRASMNKHSKKRNILHRLRGITDSYKIAVGPHRTALHLISLVLHGNIDKQSSLAYMWAWAEPFSFSLMYVPKKSSPVMKDTLWVWVLMKLQVLLLSLSTILKFWSTHQYSWPFQGVLENAQKIGYLSGVLNAFPFDAFSAGFSWFLHSDMLLPCTLMDISNVRRVPKPRFTFASVLMHSSGFWVDAETGSVLALIHAALSPPCFAMPAVWKELSSLQTPGHLGEGEPGLASVQLSL